MKSAETRFVKIQKKVNSMIIKKYVNNNIKSSEMLFIRIILTLTLERLMAIKT